MRMPSNGGMAAQGRCSTRSSVHADGKARRFSMDVSMRTPNGSGTSPPCPSPALWRDQRNNAAFCRLKQGVNAMLMQNFKSAADLKITEPQLSALQKTLVLLETGRIKHAVGLAGAFYNASDRFDGLFNMNWWANEHGCGTVCCIGGTAELVGGTKFENHDRPKALDTLFYPGQLGTDWGHITPAQAATALRSYLTTGDARWDLAVA
jgi:hypothetical protein